MRAIQELEEKIAEKKQAREARFAEKRSRGKKSKKNVGFFGGIAILSPRSLVKNQKKAKVVQEIDAIPKGKIDAHIQKIETVNFQKLTKYGCFRVEGNRPLEGEIKISGSKIPHYPYLQPAF